jgi:hypothetical protein
MSQRAAAHLCPGCGRPVRDDEAYVLALEHEGDSGFALHGHLPDGARRRFHVEHFRSHIGDHVYHLVNEERSVDDEQFQSLLEQVRELHRLADEVTRERARIDANVRARLSWDDRNAPHLPPQQREVADEAVEALSKPRLSRSQSKQLYKAFFGR